MKARQLNLRNNNNQSGIIPSGYTLITRGLLQEGDLAIYRNEDNKSIKNWQYIFNAIGARPTAYPYHLFIRKIKT